jgi:hypothetical protein
MKKYKSTAKSEANHHNADHHGSTDYSVIFRERFCIAAADLAEQMHAPLENLGVLYDEIFNTGEMLSTSLGARRKGEPKLSEDEERNIKTVYYPGKGQLLVLVRCAEKAESDRLAASGYRFADIQTVAPILSRGMKINCADLPGRLTNMYEYSKDTPIISPGVHVAFFALRASVRGGFDILVPKSQRNQLPAIRVPIDGLKNWETEYLSQLDGMSVSACLKFLNPKSSTATTVTKEQIFAVQFRDTLVALNDAIDDPLFNDALLIAQPLPVPCRGPNVDSPPGKATIFAFRLIVPIQFRARGAKLEFVPLSFFRTQQYVHKNSPDHSHFARKVHREFGPILSRKMSIADGRRMSIRSSTGPRDSGDGFKRLESEYGDGALDVEMPRAPARAHRRHISRRFWRRHEERERETVTPPRQSLDSGSEAILVEAQAFGGIMVSQEVSVIVGERDEELPSGGEEEVRGAADGRGGTEMVKMMPLAQLWTRGGAMKEMEEPETYVDRLIAVCVTARG